jgi:hypothetical protein
MFTSEEIFSVSRASDLRMHVRAADRMPRLEYAAPRLRYA